MCGVDVDRRSSDGTLLLDERLFLLEWRLFRAVVSGLVKVACIDSRRSVGLGVEAVSARKVPTPGLRVEGWKDIA